MRYVIIIIVFILVLKKMSFFGDKINAYFKYSEFGNVPFKYRPNILRLVDEVLYPLRKYTNKPVIITSGYRTQQKNSSLEFSSDKSQHMTAEAVDFIIPGLSNEQIIYMIKYYNLPYDQLIDEQLYSSDGKLKKWIHLSLKKKNNRAQFLQARNSKNDLKPKFT